MNFPCTQCGLCCQQIKGVQALENYHLGDGLCIYYEASVGCEIYQSRPDICRIDEGYVLFFTKIISHQDYYQKNADACNKLQIKNNMDKRFRVKL